MKTKTILIGLIILASVLFTNCNPLLNSGSSLSGDQINETELLRFSENLTSFDSGFLTNNSRILSTSAPDRIPENRNDLNKIRTVTKVYTGKKDAGISLPGFAGLSLGKNESSVNVYYLESKVVTTSTDTVVYGCGYSIHYLFKKVEKGISIDNRASVAASAQLNNQKTQVYYSMQTYGIIGPDLVKFFKPTVNKNFDVEGFGIMQSSIDGIQNILGDTILSKSLKFEPEILKFIKPYELE